jgi:type IV pilus assembly protein PilW
MMHATSRMLSRRVSGFSVIELLVSLLMAMLLTIMAAQAFIATRSARNGQEGLSEIQSNARIALGWLQHDLRMAGNVSLTYSRAPIRITGTAGLAPAITNNCFTTATQAFDWSLALLPLVTGDPAPTVFGVDNATAANEVFGGCIDGDDLQVGSDLLSLHFADAGSIPDANLVDDSIYLDSGIGGAVVFQCDIDGAACKGNLDDARTDPTGTRNHLVNSRVYFVRSWATADGDGMPTLVRAVLGADGTVIQEPLIQGVASMQILYGIDTTNDGYSNQYVTAAQMPGFNLIFGAIRWTKVKSIKVSLLMHATAEDHSRDVANRTYDVGGTDVQLPGTFAAQVFSTTVAVRNPTSRTAT